MVVAIIVILAGVVVGLINPASILAKSRDARRLADLETLSKSLALAIVDKEIDLTTTGTCGTCTSNTGTQAVNGTGYVKFSIPIGKIGLSKYLPALPVDPINSGVNVYTYASNMTDYEFNTILESPDNVVKMTTDGGSNLAVYEIGSSLIVL